MSEKIEGLSIGLDLDTLSIDRGLTGLKDKLKTVNSEMKANMSSFDRADKSVEKYETRLHGLNKKLEVQKRVVSESKTEYEKMVKEHGEGSKEAEKAAREYNNQASALNNLQRYIDRTTKELKDFREEQRLNESSLTKLKKTAEKTGATLTGIGDKAKSIGGNLTMGITAPLAGFSVFASKMANDFEKSQGSIQSELGISAEKAKELNDVAKDLWKEGFGDSIEGVSSKIAGVTKSLGDLSKVDLTYVTKGLDLFEQKGWGDQQESLRAAKVLMEQFGMSASEAFDYLTKGFQENLDFSGEFLDSVSEYSTYFAEFGLTADDMFSKFKAGAESGAFQLDKVGDAMKEFSLRSKDGSKTSTEAFESLGLNAAMMTKQFNKGGKDAKRAFETVIKAVKNTKNETVRNAAAVGLFGTQYEDLGEKAFDAMLQASNGLKDVEGATKKASDALRDNFGARATKIWRDFVTDLEPAGEILLDLADDVLPKVANTVDTVTNAFADLSPEGKKTTLLIGGIVAGIGPLISGLGLASLGVGGLVTGLGLLTGPVGLTVLGIAGLGAGFVALDKQMDKPIIKSDIFKGKISDATKHAVGSYMKLDDDATAELNSLAWSSQTITDSIANSMVTKYQEMGDQVLQAMKENHNKQLEEQQSLFDRSSVLTEQEEAKRLAKLKADQLKEEQAHTVTQARIKEIWTTAAEEKRGITNAEAAELARLQEGMRTKAVQELSASQQEQETILTNLKNNKDIIETETAANTVKKSLATKNKVVKEANEQYNQTVSYAKSARDELGIISSKEAEKIIREAENKKNNVVSKAEDMHSEVIKEAQSQAGEHADAVNYETGEVLTYWDKLYNGIAKVWNWIAGFFGGKKMEVKGSVKENGRQKIKRQHAELKPYADGTPSSGHPGGPAIVGEEGIELAHIPGQGVTLLGTKGPEIFSNLPRGTSVLPNKQTERLLKSYGFPGYAEGIGDYFDLFLKGAGSVWDFAKDKFGLSKIKFPSWMNNLGNPIDHVKGMVSDKIKGLWDNWFTNLGSSSGAGVQKWAGVATKALMMTGQFTKSNLDKLLYQMQTESGGNPQAINLWDSNAKMGIPSKGLMQVIDPTFRAYAMPGYDKNIYDPLSNVLASIRYALSRYGSLSSAYKGVGYETGGLINTEGLYQLAEGGWPEIVIPTDPSRRTDAMKLLALAGKKIQGNKRPGQLPNVSGIDSGNILEKLLNATIEQTKILLEILNKNPDIYMNDRLVGQLLEPHVTEKQVKTKRISKRNIKGKVR